MKLFSMLVVAVAVMGLSCERHEFEDTKHLHEHGQPASHGAPAGGSGETPAH